MENNKGSGAAAAAPKTVISDATTAAAVVVAVERCRADARIPSYAHAGDAGMDVCAAEDADIFPGRTVLVPTGLKFAIPPGYEIQVRPRSGLSLRTALRIPNAPGTVDSGYREELGIIVTNTCLPSGASDIESVLDFEREKGRFPVRGLDGALIEPAGEGRRASGGEMPQAATGGETSQVTGGETSQFASGGDASLACVYRVRKGDRIAQFVLKELPVMELIEVASVAGIGEDRNGGFGSTGIGS